ncbi:MotA/TolQ/ExbB proton channel family protein [Motilimonas eburnea]|nr:MotA/TolQ/ExbB proton channel family protein [Motilimonas eburnea]
MYAIAAVLVLLWLLILERTYFIWLSFNPLQQHWLARWQQRQQLLEQQGKQGQHWQDPFIRQAMIGQAELALTRHFPLLSALIKICPLLGLLGTVSGMIQVFDVVAVHGTGNPKLLASGISMATIPTLAGLVCALSGLLVYSRLERRSKVLLSRFSQQLVVN